MPSVVCLLYVPCICISVTVAEVVHVHAVLLQAAGALLDPRQEASPVAPPLSFAVQPPGQWAAVCNNTPVPTVSPHCNGLMPAGGRAPAQVGQGQVLYLEFALHCFAS